MAENLTPKHKKPETLEEIQAMLEEIEEFGGPKGEEPTKHGDWSKAGRVSDF